MTDHLPDIHIGALIRQELERQSKSPSWLANKINMSRTNMYYVFSQKSINTDVLLAVSKALDCDFFASYSKGLEEMTGADTK
ncbi:MAG: helix-turn-helix domain-containing protein [Muribaculaceae bacterium]|nr:helix-turn-helix domain-containing protein [Muribaculaceae bacterium]